MGEQRRGLASVSLGSTKEIALRLIAEGRFENLSEACRAGLRRLDEHARVIDFDIDAFVEETRGGA